MTRKDELSKVFENVDNDKKTLISQVIDEAIFLEERLVELKKLPFIKVHPNDPTLQKQTIAGKQYKELSQSYLNAIKILVKCLGADEGGEESPLRAYLSKLQELD